MRQNTIDYSRTYVLFWHRAVTFGRQIVMSNYIELDLLPEYCRYRDNGCDLADSCLNCPFSKCIYEEPGGRRRWLKGLRDKEMARLFSAGGKGIKELALVFGVSQRTVQRAIKGVKK